MTKRILSVCLALVLLFGVLAGCSKKEAQTADDTKKTEQSDTEDKTSTQFAYQAQYYDLPEDIQWIGTSCVTGDTLYFTASVPDGGKETYTDENGEVTCLHCTYDPESRGGETPDGRKVRGTLHWVSAADNVKAQVRLYDRLFNTENPAGEDGNGDYLQNINPDSLKIIDGCLLEGGLRDAKPGDTFQFMRQGYFCVDKDSTPGNLIINRTVALNSSWDKKKK